MQFTRLHIIFLCAALQFQLIVGQSKWYDYTGLSNDQLKEVIGLVESFLKNNNIRGQKAVISNNWISLSRLSNVHYNAVIALADGYKSENNSSKGKQGNVDSTRDDTNATETRTQNSGNPDQMSRPVDGQNPSWQFPQSGVGTTIVNYEGYDQGQQENVTSNTSNTSAQSNIQTLVSNGGKKSKPKRYICTVSTKNYDCQIEKVHFKKDQPNNVFGLERNNTQQRLTFRDSILEYLPKSLLDAFPHVTLLNLNTLRISSIEPRAFEHAVDLETVYLEDNRLVQIDEGAFHGAKKLHMLVLSKNDLTNIDDSSFEPRSFLRYFYLDRNRLTKLPAFTNTVHLIHLNASHNNLESIENAHFVALHYLETIDVSFNQLKRLNLQQLYSPLDLLDVSFNNLSELVLPEKVKRLNAENNSLTEFIVGEQCYLEKLNLAKNGLDTVPDLQACHGLKMLDLSYNLLEAFNLITMPNLETLNLAHNHLFEFSVPPKSPTLSLKLLDLSHNQLSYGPPLKAFKNLEQVLLNDNNFILIKSYPEKTRQNIKLYTMANNEWDCKEVDQFQHWTVDKNKDMCAKGMELKNGICCRVYNKPYNDRLNEILRDADFHERQNQKRCPKTESTTSNAMAVFENIQKAIASSNKEKADKLKQIEKIKRDESNLNAKSAQLREDRDRVENSKREVANQIEKQRQIHRVAKEGLISEKEMLERIIKFVKEKDAFTNDLLTRRQQDTEGANNLWENKKQEIDDVNKTIKTLQEQLDNLKSEQQTKKREKDLLEKQVNRNAPAIHGSTGRRT